MGSAPLNRGGLGLVPDLVTLTLAHAGGMDDHRLGRVPHVRLIPHVSFVPHVLRSAYGTHLFHR